jgi:hypothetical protein
VFDFCSADVSCGSPGGWCSNPDDTDDACFNNAWGCDGVCDSGLTNDQCGVCGGDNSSCADCAGIPNGDSELDYCGNCDNDSSNDCTQDCDGVWGGVVVEDSCGVCNGNGECPCVTGPDSCDCCCGEGEFQDDCGACHTDPADACQVDCSGQPGGDATQDQCGVCDDDSSNDNTTCCPTDVCLSLEECSQGECSDKKLVYTSNSNIFGFQFDHSDCINTEEGAGGGEAANAGFTITNSSSVVLGFSFSGGSITEDSGIFLELTEGNNPLISECLSDFQFSGIDGITLEVDYNTSQEEELTGCDLPENNIYILNNNVLYNIPSNFLLFRFDVDGANVIAVSGGDAAEAGFNLTAMTLAPSTSNLNSKKFEGILYNTLLLRI